MMGTHGSIGAPGSSPASLPTEKERVASSPVDVNSAMDRLSRGMRLGDVMGLPAFLLPRRELVQTLQDSLPEDDIV